MQLLNKAALFGIKIYKKYISSLLPPTCRFEPSCSEYAYQAFSKFPFFRAVLLSLWRLLRCNPFCAGGHDPVPSDKTKISSK